ncbi:MAG: response regulator transcription factor, partial [Gammaproteobacteria bacterium]|nr:response regulator transcription factor [Gammaproteobacteria bacterium]
MREVLIVDDDDHIRDVVRFALEKEGFVVREAGDGAEALSCFQAQGADLVILDIKMPGMDGLEVCQSLRRETVVPILFLSSKDEEVDRIIGLEMGGDDYVTKPFSPRELVARVKAVLRRFEPRPEKIPARELNHGKLCLDTGRYKTYWDGKEVILTAMEFNLLHTLLIHPGNVYTRDALMSGAYLKGQIVSDRTIDSHIRRLRAKF